MEFLRLLAEFNIMYPRSAVVTVATASMAGHRSPEHALLRSAGFVGSMLPDDQRNVYRAPTTNPNGSVRSVAQPVVFPVRPSWLKGENGSKPSLNDPTTDRPATALAAMVDALDLTRIGKRYSGNLTCVCTRAK